MAEGAEEEKNKKELHLNAVVPLQQVHQEQTASSSKRNGGAFSVSLSKMKGGAFSARHHCSVVGTTRFVPLTSLPSDHPVPSQVCACETAHNSTSGPHCSDSSTLVKKNN